MKVETVYASKDFTAQVITAEYEAPYSEKDFNPVPAVSFALHNCFCYRSGTTALTIDANHILFEKGGIDYTVSKFKDFKKDTTLTIQFPNPETTPAHFSNRHSKHAQLQKRGLRTEILLRRFMPIAFTINEVAKEQALLDLVGTLVFNNASSSHLAQGKPHCIKQIDQAKDFIHAYYPDDIRIADIARSAHLSPFHFSRLFRMLTGYSPYDYLLLTRIEHAKALLQSGCSATKTCFSVGFKSLENFSFAFHKIVSSPPSAFKKKQDF